MRAQVIVPLLGVLAKVIVLNQYEIKFYYPLTRVFSYDSPAVYFFRTG